MSDAADWVAAIASIGALGVSVATAVGAWRGTTKAKIDAKGAFDRAEDAMTMANQLRDSVTQMATSFMQLQEAHGALSTAVEHSYETPLRAQELLRSAL